MSDKFKIQGVVLVLLNPDGFPLCAASDFSPATYGGYSISASQYYRANNKLKRRAIKEIMVPDLFKCLNEQSIEWCYYDMLAGGFKSHMIEVDNKVRVQGIHEITFRYVSKRRGWRP